MKTYLANAQDYLKHCKPLLSDYAFRNRVIARACRIYLADNLKLVYESVEHDIVNDPFRAEHHGVAIGTSLGLKGCLPRKDRYAVEARVKRQLKKEWKLIDKL